MATIYLLTVEDFIDSNKNKPFFIYYSMALAHKPFCPTPDDPAFAGWDPLKMQATQPIFHLW